LLKSTNMRYDNTSGLIESGFSKFASVCELQQTNCAGVPIERGVYLVVRLIPTKPEFLIESIGGYYKEQNPTVPIITLQEKWVESTIVLYIGKAGNQNGKVTLRNRLRQYMDFGQGLSVPIGVGVISGN
jgi:hypothetical protein